jgi:cobalamin biosynthesis protein CobT
MNAPPSKPTETHRQLKAEASSSKPQKGKTRKINKLLREIYEMEVLERVIKKENADLTEKVSELFKENETLK